MWEIILSNLITTLIVGGCILAYHLYRKHLEQKFYARINSMLMDGVTGFSQGVLYYMAWKGFLNVATIKNILETNPVFKDKHLPLPSNWLDTIEAFGPAGSSHTFPKFDAMNEYDGPIPAGKQQFAEWKVHGMKQGMKNPMDHSYGPQTQCMGGTTWKFGPKVVGPEFCQCGMDHGEDDEEHDKDGDNDTVEDVDSVDSFVGKNKKFYGKMYPMQPKPKLQKQKKKSSRAELHPLHNVEDNVNEKDSDIGIKVDI